MELFGVGPIEFLFIVIIALIVLGPKDMAKTGRTVGKWLNNLIQSDTWKVVRKTSDELRRLPTQLMRESNYDKFLTEIDEPAAQKKVDSWSGRPKEKHSTLHGPQAADEENSIQPQNSKAYVEGIAASTLKTSKKKPPEPAAKKSPPTKKTGKRISPKASTRTTRKKTNA